MNKLINVTTQNKSTRPKRPVRHDVINWLTCSHSVCLSENFDHMAHNKNSNSKLYILSFCIFHDDFLSLDL